MKKCIFIIALLIPFVATFAQSITKWKSDKDHSRPGFTVTHMMINNIVGQFDSLDVTVTTTRKDFNDAVVELTTDTKLIDTDKADGEFLLQ